MTILAILAALIFLYSLLSHRLERTIITGPMIFTTAGILLYFALPDQLAGPLEVKPVLRLMEIALAVVLFTDGTRIRVSELIGSAHLPGRLLGIGMPLIILAGTILAALMFTGLSIWEAAILGCVLAPTDAGVGHAVMSKQACAGAHPSGAQRGGRFKRRLGHPFSDALHRPGPGGPTAHRSILDRIYHGAGRLGRPVWVSLRLDRGVADGASPQTQMDVGPPATIGAALHRRPGVDRHRSFSRE